MTETDFTKSPWDYIQKLPNGRYLVKKEIRYFSLRYKKWVVCEVNDDSDGATYARDIKSFGWIIHDDVKRTKKFEDGSKCSNWQASNILSDILKRDGYWFRARSWFITTLAWGTVVH